MYIFITILSNNKFSLSFLLYIRENHIHIIIKIYSVYNLFVLLITYNSYYFFGIYRLI